MRSKYKECVEPNMELITAWVRDGIPDSKIAERLGVAWSTLRDYKKRYPSLQACFVHTKEIVDNVEMVNAYKRRAEGYTTIEHIRTWKIETDPETGEQVRVLKEEKEMEKHVPGDPRAMENWLQLRQPEMWRHKAEEAEETGAGGVVFIPSKVIVQEPIDIEYSDDSPKVDLEPVDREE